MTIFKRYAMQAAPDKSGSQTNSISLSSAPSAPQPQLTPSQCSSVPILPPSTSETPTVEKHEEGNAPQATSNDSHLTMPLDAFTTFLLSPDNSPLSEKEGQIWQDMTRPLPEYFISSSHNTYLVGHQLVGVSTIEGYVRALLHSCRSVESKFPFFAFYSARADLPAVDIYDGETEPVITHGGTLTSKVPLRDICEAIAKYAFVASPYPIIISAEVHCSVTQQGRMAKIMHEVFGDTLVSAPPDGRPPIRHLPSPEDLRGRVLLKAKNLYVSPQGTVQEAPVTVETESSSSTSDTSPSDSEFVQEFKTELKHELNRARHVDAVKGMWKRTQTQIVVTDLV